MVHGDLDPDDSQRNGNGVWIKDDDRVYQNLKEQLFQNRIKYDDLAAAVGELELRSGHGYVDELPSFGRKFSVNDFVRSLLLATLLKDESVNSIAKPPDEDSGKHDGEPNLTNPLPQSTLSRYQDDVVRLSQPYFSCLQDDVIDFIQATKHSDCVRPTSRRRSSGPSRPVWDEMTSPNGLMGLNVYPTPQNGVTTRHSCSSLRLEWLC